ncbi:MAG: hypothetical protein QM778_14950 [Myxococcales bacterium]
MNQLLDAVDKRVCVFLGGDVRAGCFASGLGERHDDSIVSANWFVALPISFELDLEQFAAPPGVRLFARADRHITVAFLGPVSPGRALAAFQAARDIPLKAIEVSLGAIEALGSPRRPSAFSALLARGRSEVEHAMGAVRALAWDAAEAQHDARPPLAHVTLARPRRAASHAERTRALDWARALALPEITARLTELALYTWSDDRSQTLFRIEQRAALAADLE